MQLPKEQQQRQSPNVQELQQAVNEWGDDSFELESLNDVHPLAVQESFEQRETGSTTHGQDFSHMFDQPTIINVQLEDEEERGIEVGHVTSCDHHMII